MNSNQLLTISDVRDVLQISASTLLRLRRHGFPQPVVVSAGAVRWTSAQIDAWVAKQGKAEVAA